MQLKNWIILTAATVALTVLAPAGGLAALAKEPKTVVKVSAHHQRFHHARVRYVRVREHVGPVVGFNESAEADLLRNAYHILATGDHDYNGHRARAMHAIEAAARLVGLDLKGDGQDKVVQSLSDDRLRDAKAMVERASRASSLTGHRDIHKHLSSAVRELDTALQMR